MKRYKRNPCQKGGGGKSKLVKYRDDLISVCYRITCTSCGHELRDNGIDNEEVIIRLTKEWNRDWLPLISPE